MDIPGAREASDELANALPELTVHRISSHTREGIDELKEAFWKMARPGIETI